MTPLAWLAIGWVLGIGFGLYAYPYLYDMFRVDPVRPDSSHSPGRAPTEVHPEYLPIWQGCRCDICQTITLHRDYHQNYDYE